MKKIQLLIKITFFLIVSLICIQYYDLASLSISLMEDKIQVLSDFEEELILYIQIQESLTSK